MMVTEGTEPPDQGWVSQTPRILQEAAPFTQGHCEEQTGVDTQVFLGSNEQSQCCKSDLALLTLPILEQGLERSPTVDSYQMMALLSLLP